MIDADGNLHIVDPVGYLGTGEGAIEVVLGHSPTYYRLLVTGDDFDERLQVLVTAWRSKRSVRATISGTTIVAVEPA